MSNHRLLFNPYFTNGLSHCSHLEESTFTLRDTRSDFDFDAFSLSKQNSPRWDAAFCGVSSGATVYSVCVVPIKRTLGLYELRHFITIGRWLSVFHGEYHDVHGCCACVGKSN